MSEFISETSAGGLERHSTNLLPPTFIFFDLSNVIFDNCLQESFLTHMNFKDEQIALDLVRANYSAVLITCWHFTAAVGLLLGMLLYKARGAKIWAPKDRQP